MFEQVMGRGVDFVKRLRTDQLPVIVIVSKVRYSITHNNNYECYHVDYNVTLILLRPSY